MKNPDMALKVFPSRCFVERCVLEGYKRYGLTDHFSAFAKVPRNMRLMYVHSLQSLIWNRVVGRRIRDFGLVPIIGDLVTKQSIEELNDEEVFYSFFFFLFSFSLFLLFFSFFLFMFKS